MKKFSKPIPYMRNNIDESTKNLVIDVLDNQLITQGKYVELVENKMSELNNKKFSIMTANGTASLHLVAHMLKNKSNIKKPNIITTPLTFVADANFGRYINADVKFADIDKHTWTISSKSVESLVDENTLAIVAPHFAGLMFEAENMIKVAKKYNITLVEDACHAPNAIRDGFTAGGVGDLSTFSFHATKHIGAGEGGLISTNSEEEYFEFSTLRSHGLPHWSKRTGYGYDIKELAFNYRPNEIAAAIAYSHILNLNELIDLRIKIAQIYDKNLDFSFFQKQQIPNKSTHVYHLYPILVPSKDLRNKFLSFLKDANIFAQIHYPAINKMTGFSMYNSNTPISDDITERIVSIPIFPTLTKAEQDFVVEKINEFAKINS